MMTKKSLYLVGALVLMPVFAFAEGGTCPAGYYPIGGGDSGWSSCAPLPESGGTSSSPPIINSQVWKTQWISIATGVGAYGVGKDQPSRRKAEKAAIADCRTKGGENCRVAVSTYNQCAAISGGSTTLFSAWDDTLEGVERRSVDICQDKQGNMNCQVYYADCSYPKRMR